MQARERTRAFAWVVLVTVTAVGGGCGGQGSAPDAGTTTDSGAAEGPYLGQAPPGMTQLTPGIAFIPSTTSARRASKAASISATGACGPVRAAMPANWAAALTQEWALTAMRSAASTRPAGQMP